MFGPAATEENFRYSKLKSFSSTPKTHQADRSKTGTEPKNSDMDSEMAERDMEKGKKTGRERGLER
jgi:hypothetical protein